MERSEAEEKTAGGIVLPDTAKDKPKQGTVIAVGPGLDRAMWLAVELETLARQYFNVLLIGGAVILSDAEVADAGRSMGTYGVQEPAKP